MKIIYKNWFGLCEFYCVVEQWRDGYARWNRFWSGRRVKLFIIDREYWESLDNNQWG